MVGALWPGTEGELLRLGGPQWGEMNAWVLGQAQLKCVGERRDRLDPRRTSSPQGRG